MEEALTKRRNSERNAHISSEGDCRLYRDLQSFGCLAVTPSFTGKILWLSGLILLGSKKEDTPSQGSSFIPPPNELGKKWISESQLFARSTPTSP